ncbi:MAG: pyridoxamine 5'-phosphate oxidase family protein [Burkholderiaceae bacterium]
MTGNGGADKTLASALPPLYRLAMALHFDKPISTREQLRGVLGEPSPRVVAKVIDHIDVHCRGFIAKSPFLLLATANGDGKVDVSPKGDPAGFVHVLDAHTLAIPERLGNRLADSFLNMLERPQVGLLFMIPGKPETLRAGGTARIVQDDWLLEKMAVRGKAPQLATVVTVERIFFHCAKCVVRSHLWQSDAWPDLDGVPSLAEAIIDHAKLHETVQQVQAGLDESYRDRLY